MNLQKLNFAHLLNINLIYGIDATENNLAEFISEEQASKVFIATDPGIVSSGILDKVTNILNNHHIDYSIFSEVEPNPIAATVMKGEKVYEQEKCDLIIALGGGSSMDFAKAVSAVAGNGGHILEYKRGKKTLEKECPTIIAIPTTVGTGSEVTSVSVITDPEAKRKYIVASPYIQPKYAIVDPVLTYTLPKRIVASTGMDALVHAIESYTSIAATPFSESFSIKAIQMLVNYLPTSYQKNDDHEARSQIHLASTLAGIAFHFGKLGIVHSCSHPLSARYGVPHGLANAIILPYVLEFNHSVNNSKFAEIARKFDQSLYSFEDNEAAGKLADVVHQFNAKLDIPTNFGHLNIGFSTQMIEQLAEEAMDDVGTFPFNPRKATKADIVAIYKKVLL